MFNNFFGIIHFFLHLFLSRVDMAERNLCPKKRPKPADPEDAPASPRQKKNRADYSWEFRVRVNANPELYHQHRAAENERNKKYRETRGDEAVLHNRELQKIQQQKYRERLKEKDQLEQRPKTPQTQKNLLTVRQKNRERKQLQRENMSHNKKSAINKKRREAYAAKQSKKTASVKKQCIITALPQPNMTSSQPSTSSGSAALWTTSSRFRKKFLSSLPAALSTQAHLIAAGLQALSPTTKNAVNSKLGIVSPKSKRQLDLDSQVNMSLKDQLELLKTRRSAKDLRLRQLLAKAVVVKSKAAAQYFSISRKLMRRVGSSSHPGWEDSRIKKKDVLPPATIKEVLNFFESGAVSRDLPDTRGTVVKNGVVKPRKIMESLLQSAYKCYVEEHGQSLSFASFKKLWPHTVLPFTTHKFRECLSEWGLENQSCKFPPCKSTSSLYWRSLPGFRTDPVPQRSWGRVQEGLPWQRVPKLWSWSSQGLSTTGTGWQSNTMFSSNLVEVGKCSHQCHLYQDAKSKEGELIWGVGQGPWMRPGSLFLPSLQCQAAVPSVQTSDIRPATGNCYFLHGLCWELHMQASRCSTGLQLWQPTSALSVRIQAQLSQTQMSSSAVICSMTTMLCSILLERLLNCCLVKMSCLTESSSSQMGHQRNTRAESAL